MSNKLLLTVLGFFITLPLFAADFISSKELEDYAVNLIKTEIRDNNASENTHINNIMLDSRIKMPQCHEITKNLVGSIYDTRVTVQIACKDPSDWKINIPISLKQYKNVVITKSTVAKGERIVDNDVILTKLDTNKLSSHYFTSVGDVIGKVAKRNLKNGIVVTSNTITAPILIEKGQIVTAVSEEKGLRISAEVIAQEKGKLNEVISLKNKRSGRIISGLVLSSNEIRIQ